MTARFRLTVSTGVMLLASAVANAQQPAATPEAAPAPVQMAPATRSILPFGSEFWTSQTFVNSFMGSYGINPDIEPKLKEDEKTLLAQVAQQMLQDPNAAFATLSSAIKSDSSPSLLLVQGNLHYQFGRLNEAATCYEKAISGSAGSSFMRAHRNLGVLYVRQSRYAEAIKSLARAVELGGGDALSYGMLGYCYLQQRDFLAAESAYRNALVYDAQNQDWKLGLASTVFEQKRFKEAASLAEELIKATPNNANLWLFQADAFLGSNETLRAAANYEVVRRLDKASGKSLVLLGDIYANSGAYDIAVEAYIEALTRNGDISTESVVAAIENMVSHNQWAHSNTLLKKTRETIGRRLSPDERARLELAEARVNVATQSSENARKILEQILAKNPLDGSALLLLAQEQCRSKDYERAAFLFERAERISGFETQAYKLHAQMLIEQRQFDKALTLLQKAQEIMSDEGTQKFLEQVRLAARAVAL